MRCLGLLAISLTLLACGYGVFAVRLLGCWRSPPLPSGAYPPGARGLRVAQLETNRHPRHRLAGLMMSRFFMTTVLASMGYELIQNTEFPIGRNT